jgi:hypothetical protein
VRIFAGIGVDVVEGIATGVCPFGGFSDPNGRLHAVTAATRINNASEQMQSVNLF